MEHRVAYKVYYEDTDCLGVVYYGLFRQRIERGGELIVEADVEIVCLDARQELIEFPNQFVALAGDTIHS